MGHVPIIWGKTATMISKTLWVSMFSSSLIFFKEIDFSYTLLAGGGLASGGQLTLLCPGTWWKDVSCFTQESSPVRCALVRDFTSLWVLMQLSASFQVRRATGKGSIPRGVDHRDSVVLENCSGVPALRHSCVSCKVTFCHTAVFLSGKRMFSRPEILEAETKVKKTIVF